MSITFYSEDNGKLAKDNSEDKSFAFDRSEPTHSVTPYRCGADLVQTLHILLRFRVVLFTFPNHFCPFWPLTPDINKTTAIVKLLYPISVWRSSPVLLLRAWFDQRWRYRATIIPTVLSRVHLNAIKRTSWTKPNKPLACTDLSLHSVCQSGSRWGQIQCKEEKNTDMVAGDCLERCMRAAEVFLWKQHRLKPLSYYDWILVHAVKKPDTPDEMCYIICGAFFTRSFG